MNEQAIFLAALDIADPAERAAYVKETCAGDATLLRQVESLLTAHLRSGAFLDVPALKQIAAGASEGQHSPDETSAEQDSAEDDSAKAEIDLSFLQPSAKPGSLGRLGHYEVQGIIGRGGFGIVLKAFDEMLHRVVAIKVLARELAATSPARKRFLREARAAAAIRHENVVSIYSVEEQPLPYLVMEYIAGQTLQQKLDQSGPLGVREVVQIGQQIATGLEAAHAMGLIHRDIKPGNILLENGVNRVKITDFGLARTSDDASLTQSGVIAGTPLYMSPEQAKGDVIDQRSDLFSLGSVLYVMCSGRPPFRAATTVAVLMRVVEHQPRPIQQIIPEVPEWLTAIIGKLHAKQPSDRFASAQEVAGLLARCLSELQQHGKVESVGDFRPMTGKPASAGREPVEGERPTSDATPVPALDRRPPLPTQLARTGASRQSSPRRKTLIAASAAFLLLAGVIVIVRDEKGNIINRILGQIAGVKSESPDGTSPDTRKQDLDDGTPVDAASADREVAEWVLSTGGQVQCQVAEKDTIFGQSDMLPRGELKVTCIWLYEKALPATRLSQFARLSELAALYLIACDVDNEALTELRGAPRLAFLNLDRTAITVAGLAKVAPLPRLYSLNILDTAVTDGGLVELHRFPKLIQLSIQKKHLTPLGVANLLRHPKLDHFYLDSDVGDAELENLRPFKKLAYLSAGGTAITDVGLEHLVALPNLTQLLLGGTCVTDAGLGHVAQLKQLTFLKVSRPEMSDAGLRQLYNLTNLRHLDVRPTMLRAHGDEVPSENKVTAAGVAALRKALPNCQIVWDDPAESTAADPDRRAAEYVLSVSGEIRINGEERQIAAIGDLPSGAFELTYVELVYNQKVSDAGLAHFENCQHLTHLNLHGAQLSDAGLAHFKHCKDLTYLALFSAQVGDAGMAHFKDCKRLTHLLLNGATMSDAGLAHFKDCKHLTYLDLSGTRVSDSGLNYFKECDNLTNLYLRGTQVSDSGLACFKDCKHLTALSLDNTKVSDAGLAYFKDCEKLDQLSLRNTQVSDAGLAHFKGLTDLTVFDLRKTKVTAVGIDGLKKALPLCKIEWDSGVIEPMPSADPDRRAAEWVLSIGGAIKILEDGEERHVAAPADLPRGAFELRAIGFATNPNVGDAERDSGLANFKDCKNLTDLNLHMMPVSDSGLVYFKDCKNLTRLMLFGTDVTDSGFGNFKDCKNLTQLSLHLTRVSDVGLANFKDCKHLTFLNLYMAPVSDAGMAHFKDCKDLTHLALYGIPVSDEGLANFKDCKDLGSLTLHSTKVTDSGLAYFKDRKSLTYLSLGNTAVSDSGLAYFKECKDLEILGVEDTQVGDSGLAHFKDCKKLTYLNLANTQMSNAGLAYFKGCKRLTKLVLHGTQVNDSGLADLTSLPSLTILNLTNTRISQRGHEQIKTAMPKCEISWIEPNRSIAESVLALGGSVAIGTPRQAESRNIEDAADLPSDYFQLRRVSLAGVTKPLDNLPEHLSWLRFPEFDRLEGLDLSGIAGLDYGFLATIHGLEELSLANVGLSDESLAKRSKLPALKRLVLDGNSISGAELATLDKQLQLTELSLANAGLSDQSLAKLPKLPALKRLVLDGNDIRGIGLIYLWELPELTDLSLGCPTLTDLTAKNLTELKQVKRLSLAGSGLTDAGIKHLAAPTSLESLDLRGTKASAAGVAELQEALPKCRIEWGEERMWALERAK